jgi:hypothetical protein
MKDYTDEVFEHFGFSLAVAELLNSNPLFSQLEEKNKDVLFGVALGYDMGHEITESGELILDLLSAAVNQ